MYLFNLVIIGHVLVNSYGVFMLQTTLTETPCHMDKDPVYHGTRLNCQRVGIISIRDIEDWMSPNITSLLLDYNNVTSLNNASFSREGDWSNLRYLGLSHNKIDSIEPLTFTHLRSLEVLNLSYNQLNLDKRFHGGQVFQGLGNLFELRLDFNQNKKNKGNYSDFLFKDLQNLVSLSLDTFNQDLEFGSLFNNTKKLSTLTLTGGMKAIRNESFQSLRFLKLRKLTLFGVKQLKRTEIDALRYLVNLDWYILSQTSQDVVTTLKSLAPFVNKTMKGIIFDTLQYEFGLPRLFSGNSIVTLKMAKYLMKICVEHFVLRNSNVFMFETGTLSSPIMRNCLKTLDLGYNPIKGFKQIFSIVLLRNLEYFRAVNGIYFNSGRKANIWSPSKCFGRIKPLSSNGVQKKNEVNIQINNRQRIGNVKDVRLLKRSDIFRVESLGSNQNSKASFKESLLSNVLPDNRYIDHIDKPSFLEYSFPRNLKICILNSVTYIGFDFGGKVKIIGGDNLKELHIADNGCRNFIGPMDGFPKLNLFDISKNNGSTMSSYFFDTMSSILYLNMANMELDVNFMARNSKRLFRPLSKLTTLDLSKNELSFMAKDTFSDNTELSGLKLAGNNFNSIPFQLSYVPRLCWLDLRDNAFRKLSDTDIEMLEDHAKITESFSLSLKGNEFYCGCVNIRFLSWLQTTSIHLDNDRNYSCILDSGQPTTTGQIKNLEAMWRKCQGYKSFLVTFILACLMILGFICCITIPRFKTQIKVFIFKTLWTSFITKTHADYPIGVCFGYADHDTNLACLKLRPFIEERLHLSTYIRHRDLLPASDMAESIMEAVNSSWRVLLVVSQYFLDDPWSYFFLKVSTYAVQTENPGRIVLILVGDGDHEILLTNLPSSLLQAVREEYIIRMTPQGNISYEDKQALKTALLYSG